MEQNKEKTDEKTEWEFKVTYHILDLPHNSVMYLTGKDNDSITEKVKHNIKKIWHTTYFDIIDITRLDQYQPLTENGWCKMCDGQPDEDGMYLVMTENGTPLLIPYIDGCWYGNCENLKGWMPIPNDDMPD